MAALAVLGHSRRAQFIVLREERSEKLLTYCTLFRSNWALRTTILGGLIRSVLEALKFRGLKWLSHVIHAHRSVA